MRYNKITFCSLILLFLISSCNIINPKKEDPRKKYLHKGLALVETGNQSIPYMISHQDGEMLGILARNNQVSGYVYLDSDGNESVVYLDNFGRISQAFSGGNIFVFDNHVGNRADVSVIDGSGRVTLHRNIDMRSQSMNVLPKVIDGHEMELQDISPMDALRIASIAVGTFLCVKAIIFTAGAAVPCASIMLTVISTLIKEEFPALAASANGFGYGVDAIECGASFPNCMGLGLRLIDDAGYLAESEFNRFRTQIAASRSALRFGGVWSYQTNSSWFFIVTTDYAADALYNTQRRCYDYFRGNFIQNQNDLFIYRLDSGQTLTVRYELISNNLLRATRMSDNAVYNFNRSSRTEGSMTPRCKILDQFTSLNSFDSMLN